MKIPATCAVSGTVALDAKSTGGADVGCWLTQTIRYRDQSA
jgi:hypothetical protein